MLSDEQLTKIVNGYDDQMREAIRAALEAAQSERAKGRLSEDETKAMVKEVCDVLDVNQMREAIKRALEADIWDVPDVNQMQVEPPRRSQAHGVELETTC